MKFVIGADHAGVDLKTKVLEMLRDEGIEVVDKGPFSSDSVDYPDFAHAVCEHVQADLDATIGILICGSGIGMSIAANKHKDIRAALVTSVEMATMAKQHNNANVLCLSSRMVDVQTNLNMVRAFMEATFEGGRHQRRVDKIHSLQGKP